MTEKQLMGLLHFQFQAGYHIISFKYVYPGYLDIEYQDRGGNRHHIGISKTGATTTYA